jgi:site-specific DNA-methyltransferase (adenine-specific)
MQTNLFNGRESLISMNTAAMLIGVSVATIHNWVKTGYLISSNGLIKQDSVDMFIEKVSGIEKLNARANKLQKDEHNHLQVSECIDNAIHSNNFNDNLGQQYENLLSESYKNKEGIYYTSLNIVDDMFSSVENIESKTFLDPCCGGGNFIIQAIAKGFKLENIYGFDIDKNAVEITRKRIFNRTGFLSDNNIVCDDFLEVAQTIKRNYDYIFTNPPWGKKLLKKQKDNFAAIYQTSKSTDTSSLFLFACLNLLATNGKLGFLLPEAFFNISTFKYAREQILSLQVERFIDYGKAFKGLLTKAQAVILKNKKPNENYQIKCQNEKDVFLRSQISFSLSPKHIFNFWADSETAEIIGYIYSLSHITLKNNAIWGLGIVTGNNSQMCKQTMTYGFVPVFRGQDITLNGLKPPSLYIANDLSKCQQVAPIELYKAKEKLIYRFISNNLIFYCDTEQRYILNSANMLILNKDFQISGKQLTELLNSEVMNWLFKNIFNTHKILRGDLELLPIHINYFKQNKKFEEKKYLDYLRIEKINGTYRIKR